MVSKQIQFYSPPTVADTRETQYLNFSDPQFKEFLNNYETKEVSSEWLIQTYQRIRDYQLYDPFHLDLRACSLQASNIIGKKRAWCVEKAILFASVLRAHGIPCRLGYATVVNHLGSNKLELYLKRKEITFHGYVNVFWNDRWTRCTPAFDSRVCRLQGVPPLEWDTKIDSLFQQEIDGGQFMEYTHYYGEFSDVPRELMESEMQKYYPHLFEEVHDSRTFSFFHSGSI